MRRVRLANSAIGINTLALRIAHQKCQSIESAAFLTSVLKDRFVRSVSELRQSLIDVSQDWRSRICMANYVPDILLP
jgi:hypothetical protein